MSEMVSEDRVGLSIGKQNRDLRGLAEAILIFHDGGEWTPEKSERWIEITGCHECTTKNLCDFARYLLAKPVGVAP